MFSDKDNQVKYPPTRRLRLQPSWVVRPHLSVNSRRGRSLNSFSSWWWSPGACPGRGRTETSGGLDLEREEGRCQDPGPGRETDRTVRGAGGATAQGGPGAGAGEGGSQGPGVGQDPGPMMMATGFISEVIFENSKTVAAPVLRTHLCHLS